MIKAEFPFSQGYLNSISLGSTARETAPETTPETTPKTPERILEVLRANPRLTLVEVAGIIGKSSSAEKHASARLVRAGRLRYMGPRKGGHWEIPGDDDEWCR